MKRNLATVLLDLDQKPFPDAPTAGKMCLMALTTILDGDNRMEPAERMKLFALAQRVHGDKIVDLSAEEIALLKKRGAATFALLAYGALVEFLEKDPAGPEAS